MKFTNFKTIKLGETMKRLLIVLLLMAAVFAQGMNFAGFNNHKLSTAPGTGVNPPSGNISIWWTVTDGILTMHWRDSAGADHTFSSGGGGITDAPSDGKQYARKDAGWVEVVTGGSSTPTALATSGTVTIPGPGLYTMTPSAAVTLATGTFTNMQEATLSISAGYGLVSFPAEWIWQGAGLPILVDVNLIKIQKVGSLFFATPLGYYTPWSANKDTLMTLDTYLKAAWKLSDLSDSKGANTLTNSTSVTFGTGKSGNAAVFNGSNGLYRETTSDFIGGTDDWTVSFWVYPTAIPGLAYPFCETNAGSDYLLIGYTVDGIRIMATGGLATVDSYDNAIVPVINAWNHFVYTRTGNVFNIYKNGTLAKTSTQSGITLPTMTKIYIGANPGATNGTTGKVDEVYLWRGHGMNAAEVTALYNSGTGSFYK